MKGKLYKTEQGWVVRHPVSTNFQHTYYHIHPYQDELKMVMVLNTPVSEFEGKEVEFEIEDFYQQGMEEVIKVAKLIRPEYPELEGTMALCNDKTWDDIFAEIEGSLHSEMPIRVKNWLKNKFKSPERI